MACPCVWPAYGTPDWHGSAPYSNAGNRLSASALLWVPVRLASIGRAGHAQLATRAATRRAVVPGAVVCVWQVARAAPAGPDTRETRPFFKKNAISAPQNRKNRSGGSRLAALAAR